jgi:hypothetical protein
MRSVVLLCIKVPKSDIEQNYGYREKCFLLPREKSAHYKNQLILPTEIICDYSENHNKFIHTICVKIWGFLMIQETPQLVTTGLSIVQWSRIYWQMKYRPLLSSLTFREPCNVIYFYNKSQRDSLYFNFIWWSNLHVPDRSTVHHQEYLNTVYTQ